MLPKSIRILGIDPGLRSTGWGLVEKSGNRLQYVASGTIKPPQQQKLSIRLLFLHTELQRIIALHNPDEAAVEETFVSPGARSALLLGQARGVCLLTPASVGLDVGEYAANVVKKSVVGTGHADKSQIQMMIRVLMPAAEFESADAADALAIAITHSHHRGTGSHRWRG